MRSKMDWQPGQHGVMLYMPATRTSVEDTQRSLSRLSVSDFTSSALRKQQPQISGTVSQSCEIEPSVNIKTEDVEAEGFNFSRDDSETTLADACSEDTFAEVLSTPMSTPESSPSEDLVTQLIAAAEGGTLSSSISEDHFARSVSPISIEDSDNNGYSSERTDFRETPPSPTEYKISRGYHKRTSATGKTSHHFQQKTQLLTGKPLCRRLDFGLAIRQQAKKVSKKSVHAQALDELRRLERTPSHRWDDDERELLCVLNRWYSGTDRRTELLEFSKIFNWITGLELRPHILRTQFENHLILYGAAAYPVFGRVFAVPFKDPEGHYTEIRALIEEEARTLHLNLRRRTHEAKIVSGTAKDARSPQTRSAYESLVRRASQETQRAAHHDASATVVSTNQTFFANTSKAVRMPPDEQEVMTDVELSPPCVKAAAAVPEATPGRPHLAFRVWDAASRTKFVDGSFIAQTFVDWPKPYPAPIAMDDPSDAGKILALLHLSKMGDTPVYISTASSLLQALSYATSMQNPQLALIDLDAACLQEENKLHHAAEVFPWLKAQGLARWARYKGNGEYFVFANIPSEAVVQTLDLEQLIKGLNNDEDCRRLLSFDAFEPGTKTTAIAAILRERNVVLNSTSARALGKTAKKFGLHESNVSLMHLQDFVARVLDGWAITKADAVDLHTISSLAAIFATSLGTHAGGHSVQDVMGAFMDGVDQGTRCIAHWSRSRSGGRRKRFREA